MFILPGEVVQIHATALERIEKAIAECCSGSP
jgi:hypothetical protein